MSPAEQIEQPEREPTPAEREEMTRMWFEVAINEHIRSGIDEKTGLIPRSHLHKVGAQVGLILGSIDAALAQTGEPKRARKAALFAAWAKGYKLIPVPEGEKPAITPRPLQRRQRHGR